MKKVTIKKTKVANKKELLNEEQKQSSEPYGTQWPNKIGKKDVPNNDGKIRDCWGNVMG